LNNLLACCLRETRAICHKCFTNTLAKRARWLYVEKREKEKIPAEKFANDILKERGVFSRKLEECATKLVLKERDGYKKEGERKNPG